MEEVTAIGIKVETVGLEKAKLSLADLAGSGKKAETAIGGLQSASERAQKSLASLASVAVGVSAGLGASELIRLTDQYTKYTAQLKLATNSTIEYANAMSQVRSISNAAQQDIGVVGTLFARIANGTRELGLSQQKMASITETVTLSLKVSGAAASESASAMLQLSQAFASGQLRGEEFNAVNEAAPRLMKALADGIGVPIGALREMASQGKITSEVMANALPRALADLREEAKSVQTIAGSFTVLKNNVLEFVGVQAQASGAVQVLTAGIDGIANNLNLITAAAGGVATAKLADIFLGISTAATKGVAGTLAYAEALNLQRNSSIAAAQAEVSSTAATVANLEATQAAILVAREEYAAKLASANAAIATSRASLQQAAATIASSTASLQAAQSAGALSFALATARESALALTGAQTAQAAATEALALAERQRVASVAELALLGQQQARVSAQVTAATAAQAAAQTALTAATSAGGAAAGLAARALGFLGGPIGAVTTLLGLGATAWMLWGNSSKSAQQTAADAVESSTAEIIANLDKQNAKLRERIALGKQLGLVMGQEPSAAQQRQFEIGKQIENLKAGRGMDGGAPPPEAARVALMQTLLKQYGELESRIGEGKALKGEDAATKSAADLVEVRERLLGVNKQYFDDLKKYQDALKNGAIDEKNYISEVTELAKKTWDSSAAGKEEAKAKREQAKESKAAEAAFKKENTAYTALVASIQGKIDANSEELHYAGKLNDAQKAEVKLNADLAAGRMKITAAHEADLRTRIAIWKAQERAKDQTKRDIEAYQEQVTAQDEVSKAYARQYDEVTRLRLAIYELRTTTENDTKRLRLEASLIGASNAQRQIAIQLYDLQIEKAKELERVGNATYMGTPAEARKARAEAEAEVERIYAQKAANVAGKAYIDEWKNTIDQVENIFVSGFADMMNNGKSGWESFCKSLKTSFYTMVAKEIYAMFAKPFVVQLVGSFIGMTGGGSAVQAGASGMGNMLGSLSNMSSMWKAISGGLNASAQLGSGFMQTAADWAYKYGMNSVGGMIDSFRYGMMSTSSWSSALASAQAGGAELAGLIGGSLMNGFAGYGISRMLSGGYSAGGWVNTAAGIASMIPGIGPIAGVVGGIINRAFGRKLKDAGIEGEFGGETGFEGRQFEFYKGGWFRSDKTKYKDLEESTRAGFADQFTVLKGSVEAMGESLGLGSDLLTDFTYKMKLSLKGLSEEDAAKKIQEEFDKIANSMGDVVLTTKDYNKEGETQIEALTRLSTSLIGANEWFKAVGDTLYTVGLAGADMASDLMDAFGGADKFAAATSNYYDKFFTDQEKVANQTRLLDEQLKKLGVETMPASREAFRDYINSIDVTTEAGQKLYASLLQMADVFDLIYSSAENIAGLKEDLNGQLMRAKGDEEGATRLERDKQLRELEKYKDPELVRLQVEVWAAEDKSKKDAEAKQAADDMAEKLAAAQKAAQDLALKNLEAAISREKEYWNQFSADAKDALSKASSYWTLVTDAAKNLRGSTEDISSWNAAQGMVFIEQAVANARKGLGLSDYDATKSAIDSATAGLSIDKYATQAELDYDKKVLAGQLDELGDFAGLAKSDAQKQIDLAADQIKRLDDTLKFWQDYGKEQVNATLSVTDAVNALYKLLDPKEQERIRKEEAEKAGLTGGSKPPTYTGGGTLGGTVTGSSSGTGIYGYDKDGRALYLDGSIGARPGEYDASGVSKNASLSVEQWERLKSGQSVYDGYWLGGKQYGLESYYWDEQKQAWLKKGSFAVGTNFVPYDMTANIHQGERIIPAADNRALIAAVQGGGNSLQLAEVVAELRSVKEELQAIKASASISAEQNRKATDVLNQVTDGGNGMRSITMNKVLTVRTT